jgi:uncharacterized membrane protein YbhN (UPF0104 family)
MKVMVILAEAETVPRRARWRRAWSIGKYFVFLALALVAVQVVLSHSDELSGAATYLNHLHPGWIVLAVSFEALSMLSFTALQRHLLSVGGVHLPLAPLVVITLAGNAMANSLPGGGAFASVFAYRQFRRKGADEALATWTLVAVTGLTAVTLATIAAAGAFIAGEDGGVSGLLPLLALMVAGPAIGVAVLLRPRLLTTLLTPPLRLSRRLTGRPRREPEQFVTRFVVRLESVTPRLHDWLIALGLAAGNWVADCTCLVAAFLAVGAPVPLRALLLAYGAAQVAANLPITPGGLGVVEGSLTVALVAFGGSTSATVAAVLFYRLLSFWVLLPLGWTAWGALALQARRVKARQAVLT